MSDKTNKLLATFFYVGDFPVAPGSLASIVGALLAIILHFNPVFYILVTIAVIFIGFKVSGCTERYLKQKDPSCIVIDEVAGALIAFFMLPLNTSVIVTTYLLFRAFDMFKLYPVNKFDEKDGSFGIMMDDIFAGIYTNIIMHIAIRFAGLV